MTIQKDNQYAERFCRVLLEIRSSGLRSVVLRVPSQNPGILAEILCARTVRSSLGFNDLITIACDGWVRVEIGSEIQTGYLGRLGEMQSFDRLCWLFGERYAKERGLLSCMSEDQEYRLVAWPDLKSIGEDTHAFHLCRMLGQESLTPCEASNRLGLSLASTFGLFNSLELCGVLVATPAKKIVNSSIWGELKFLSGALSKLLNARNCVTSE